MEKKRTAGVTILGWALIFMSLCYSFTNHLNESNGIADIVCLLIFISAIGILRLAKWAWIFLIILICLGMLFLIPEAISELIKPLELMGLIVGTFLVLGGILFYLTRPKVKEQFK